MSKGKKNHVEECLQSLKEIILSIIPYYILGTGLRTSRVEDGYFSDLGRT